MRTTLDLDEDVLEAVKEIAAFHGSTAGRVLSNLARKALEPSGGAPRVRNGVPLLPVRPGAARLTMKRVNALRDGLESRVPGLSSARAPSPESRAPAGCQ
jgi:hypothetical protein